jgi:hypothetical protein
MAIKSDIQQSNVPLLSNKIHRQHQKGKTHKVIPLEFLIFEQYQGENGEHHQGNDLLNDLQLQQCKGAAIFLVPNLVGGYHEAILKKGNEPAGQDESRQTRFLEKFQVLKFQVPVPCHRHEYVGKNKQPNGVNSLHALEKWQMP